MYPRIEQNENTIETQNIAKRNYEIIKKDIASGSILNNANVNFIEAIKGINAL